MTSELQAAIDRLEGPSIPKTMDQLTDMLRKGHDDEGNKVVDKFVEIHYTHVYVELPNHKLRVYAA